LEIIQKARYGAISVLNGSDGTLKWAVNTDDDGISPAHKPAIADINGNGNLEILFGTRELRSENTSRVHCLNHAGESCADWTDLIMPYIMGHGSPVIIGSVNQENAQIFLPTIGGIVALDKTGEELWTSGTSSGGFATPALADLDYDGTVEVCYGSYDGIFNCLNHDGSQFRYTLQGSVPDPVDWRQIHYDSERTGFAGSADITLYTLNISIIGGGDVRVSPDQNVYEADTEVTLTAIADLGWNFDHWEGDVTGSLNPEIVLMDSDKNVTAVFVQVEGYTLTVTTQGSKTLSYAR